MEAFAFTHPGHVRHNNNDGFGTFPELGLFVVVDGMGGRFSGGEGAELVIAATREAYATGERSRRGLVAAIEAANRALRDQIAGDRRWIGTGACIVALALLDSDAHLAHVGDCRIYRLRGRALEQLTENHSLRNEHLRTKHLSAEEIAAIPKNVVTRAVGMSDVVVVDARTEPALPRDLFLLTSDGLHGVLGEARIAEILRAFPSPRAAMSALADAALRADARDNLTGLLVHA